MAWALGARSKQAGEALAALEIRLQAKHPRHRVKLARQELAGLARQLEAMSYRSVLARGFSVTRKADGAILRSALDARACQALHTELVDGTVDSRVIAETDAPAPPATPPAKRKTPRKRRNEPDEPTLFSMEED